MLGHMEPLFEGKQSIGHSVVRHEVPRAKAPAASGPPTRHMRSRMPDGKPGGIDHGAIHGELGKTKYKAKCIVAQERAHRLHFTCT